MKSAAHVQKKPSTESSSAARKSRKPFFTAVVQRKQQDQEPVQAQMRVGRPGDRHEREADRVADRVVAGGSAGPIGGVQLPAPAQRRADEAELQTRADRDREQALQAQAEGEAEEELQAQTDSEGEEEVQAQADGEAEEELQAQTDSEGEKEVEAQADGEAEEELKAQADGEGEEELQAQADDEGDEALQARSDAEEELQAQADSEGEEEIQARSAGAGVTVNDEVADRIRASRGRGDPLPATVRARMEQQFNADFSGVRIHTDHVAVQLSRAIRAQAFTRGDDIFFNAGRFDPDSQAGRHLLAHELTHTIQQGAARQPGDTRVQRKTGTDQADGYDLRPEVAEAIRLARGEIGKVNAKVHGGDGKRIGWQRLHEYFHTALGGPVIHDKLIERVITISGENGPRDALPSWCGIFTWWAMKKAGIPLPDWKLGAPALDALKPRPPGELPRKGDIAIDVIPYNHFAMVSGLESIANAEGKPQKLVRVATINGNTAGEDNLGGQVQEKWHTLGHWDHFLDPVGRMSLPDVPLVHVGRERGDADTPPTPSDTIDATAPRDAGQSASGTDVSALQQGVEPSPADVGGTAPETDLSLPPPLAQGQAEQVAVVDRVDLGGSSDQAASRFLASTPSAMAASQPMLAPAVDGKMKDEQRTLANAPPKLAAKTSGRVDAPLIGPDELPVPGDSTLDDGIKGRDRGALPHVSDPTPRPFTGNAEREREIDNEQSGSFWDRFKAWMQSFTDGIRTHDDSIQTSAGDTPGVDLSGTADVSRMDTQREQGTGKLKTQRDSQVGAFRKHPGQANIQPRRIDEARGAPVSSESAVSITAETDNGMRDYAEAPLPADVRALADKRIDARLRPRLTPARTDVAAAAAKRDGDRKREIDASQAAADQLNSDTDSAQRRLVLANRGKVARLQGEGIGEAFDNVNAFGRDAAAEQTRARRAIGDHVKTEEGRARKKLTDAEREADKRKKAGEREAAEKKRELKKEQKKKSWWGRLKGAVKRAVKAVTKAIDKVFTAVRNAVKVIIETAKNAAIGLINRARNWVVDKLDGFRTWAKSQVDKYLKDRFPGLARRINNGIDAVTDKAIAGVNKVADAAIAGIEKLAKALAKVLDKILAAFQTALKTVVRVAGAAMTGDFAGALRAAIEGACEIAGINPKPVFDFLDRAGQAVMRILKAPVRFVKNLFGAIGSGVRGFFTNIKQHLVQGVIGWLTGALSEINLRGPFEFTPKGILNIVLQVLGITYANIKARVIRRFPKAEKMFSTIEKGFGLLRRLVFEGPVALWQEIKASFANLKEMVLGAIRSWLIVTAIKEGITWLLSFTNPASAIVKIVKLVFDLVMFLVERARQIIEFVRSVYDAVAAMAAGNFKKVTTAVEQALARSVPVLISLFAAVLGLGGIAKQVKRIIAKITRPINRAIDKVVDKIVAYARKLLRKVRAGAKKAKKKAKAVIKKLRDWWKARSGFKDASGHAHTLSYKGQRKAAKLYVASSNPTHIPPFLKDRRQQAKAGGTSYTLAQVQAAELYYTNTVVPAEKKLVAADSGSSANKKVKDVNANKALLDNLQKHLDQLGKQYLRHMFGPSPKDFPPPRLPVMADNVQARSFTADYLVRGNKYPYSVKTGSESGRHVGNLDGWSALQNAGLTVGSTYVRMHLLPHRLGGDAVDSNLTPASGPKFNVPFSGGVEQPAINASTEGTEPKRKPIWYKFDIAYHGGPPPGPAFPSLLEAEWGYYKRDPGKDTWSRDKRSGHKRAAPPLPAFTPVAPDINDPATTAGDIANAAGVDSGFGTLILQLRNSLGSRSFGTSQGNFTRKMNDRYVDRSTGATRRGVQNYAARLDKVKTAIRNGKLLLK